MRAEAIRLLARREFARLELVGRLASQGTSRELAEAVADDLADTGLQSDQRFVESFVRSKVERAFGPERIRVELQSCGAASDLIERSLAEVDWDEAIVRSYVRRFKGVTELTPKTVAARMRYLASRGFSIEQIQTLLQRFQIDSPMDLD